MIAGYSMRGTLSLEKLLFFKTLIIVQVATYIQLYLFDCRIKKQSFYNFSKAV